VLESFASLIESRQRERRWHQKMDKFLDPEFVFGEIRVFSSLSFSFLRDESFYAAPSAVSVGAIGD